MSDFLSSTPLSDDERIARLRLIRTDTVGPITFRHLLGRYGSAVQAIAALPDLAAKGGRLKALKIPSQTAAKREMERAKQLNITLLFMGEPGYPPRLAAIEDAPPLLYCKGHIGLLNSRTVGIVGARNASAAGIKISASIAGQLSEAGIVTASGLARGIDTAAHAASLDGGTIACVAGGVDNIYPKENVDLYNAIAERGLIISEMPIGTKPQARHFPRRNRLISGISVAILVVEAAAKSGSLITARLAAEQGREVMAIPGNPLDPRAKGANQLIRDGAALVESGQDIIRLLDNLPGETFQEDSELPLFAASAGQPINDSDRRRILELLTTTPIAIDDLIRVSHMDAGTVLSILLELELAGHAIRYPGGRVSRLSELEV